MRWIDYETIQLKKEIGNGSTGKVYIGLFNHEIVAIKEFHSLNSTQECYKQEASKLKGLNHPRITNYQEFFMHSTLGIIMEFMEEGSLAEAIETSSRFPILTLLTIAQDAALGMNYLHFNEVVHGSLTSSNILLDRNRRAKISGFGFIELKKEKYYSQTNHTMESFNSDVYSFGTILWELGNWKRLYNSGEKGVPDSLLPFPNDELSLSGIIEQCWNCSPQNRVTTFSNLLNSFSLLMDALKIIEPATNSLNPSEVIQASDNSIITRTSTGSYTTENTLSIREIGSLESHTKTIMPDILRKRKITTSNNGVDPIGSETVKTRSFGLHGESFEIQQTMVTISIRVEWLFGTAHLSVDIAAPFRLFTLKKHAVVIEAIDKYIPSSVVAWGRDGILLADDQVINNACELLVVNSEIEHYNSTLVHLARDHYQLTTPKKTTLKFSGKIPGHIPPVLGLLDSLTVLDLRNACLVGVIPKELGNLENLEKLYMSNSRLEGSIPAELGNLRKLVKLSLYQNMLSGKIPDELSNLMNLVELALHDNELEGEIPLSFQKLKKLRKFSFTNNKISGTVPIEMGQYSVTAIYSKGEPNLLLFQGLNTLMVLASALASWKASAVILNADSPIVVVLSESMTPVFERGDLLFLSLTQRPLEVGDIAVYQIKGQAIPIVHRVLETHLRNDTGKLLILTKGDYNNIDDRGLYNRGQLWIEPEDVIGRVYAHCPYLGMITIIINDYPQAKTALIAILAITALLSKEETK